MEFQELAAHRHSLQVLCQQHAASVLRFRCPRGSFRLWVNEPELPDPARHLTTTATCIESLLDCPSRFWSSDLSPDDLAKQFARDALGRKNWVSEGSAEIYCRCRTLPLVVRHLDTYDPEVETHLERIFQQLEEKKAPGRFAIGETAPPNDDGIPEDDPKKWYPPNAFHTYWTLELMRELQRPHWKDQYRDVSARLGFEDRRRSMVLWARHALALQVSLHAAESSVLDTDQLGWSLAVVLKFGELGEEFHFELAEQDFIREAVRRLFQTQLDVGTWRHYRSLFHYRDAGNAYCYVFETFAVLLSIALTQNPSAQFFRQCLYYHAPKLVKLWEYAHRTQMRLPGAAPKLIGWCSGHRINQRDAEGWATASVFSFVQNLRRLLGVWTREEALKKLNVRTPEAAAKNPLQEMAERGDTWCQGPVGVANQLCTTFVNPILKSASSLEADPDDQPIAEDQARSAILFGPPGTSKTYLAGCVAAAVGWQYVEVHASDFVAEGLPQVQRTADEIFRRLMELDQTVVLFDEIDELVREREQEHDAFGRFLTTSMLPKLADCGANAKSSTSLRPITSGTLTWRSPGASALML